MRPLTYSDIKKIHQVTDLSVFNDLGLLESFSDLGIDNLSDYSHLPDFQNAPWRVDGIEL